MGRFSTWDLAIWYTCTEFHETSYGWQDQAASEWCVFSTILSTCAECSHVHINWLDLLYHHAFAATISSCLLHIGLHCVPESGLLLHLTLLCLSRSYKEACVWSLSCYKLNHIHIVVNQLMLFIKAFVVVIRQLLFHHTIFHFYNNSWSNCWFYCTSLSRCTAAGSFPIFWGLKWTIISVHM